MLSNRIKKTVCIFMLVPALCVAQQESMNQNGEQQQEQVQRSMTLNEKQQQEQVQRSMTLNEKQQQEQVQKSMTLNEKQQMLEQKSLLTLQECLELASQHNKQIEAAGFMKQKAEFDARSVKASFFPSLTLTGTGIYTPAEGKYSSGSGMLPVFGTDGKPTGTSAFFPGIDLALEVGTLYSIGVKLEQPIYMGGKIRQGYKMQRLGSEIAVQNVKLSEQEVVVATSKAYANVVRANQMLGVAKAYNQLLKELMRNVEKAKQHGMKSQNDVLKIKVKLNESELNVRRAENAGRLASMNLCHYIGYNLASKIEVDTLLPAVKYSSSSGVVYSADSGSGSNAGWQGNTLYGGDITLRPEYIMLEKKSELARRNIALVRSEGLPQIGLMGQYGYLQGFELNQKNLFGDWNYLVGLKLSIPIYNFGNKANKVRSAKAAYNQTLAEQEDTNQLLELEMVQAANNLNEASLELQLAESSVASANENLRVSRREYEVGVESLSNYLEAQTIWHQAQETLVDARINRYLLLIEYLKASGSLTR